MLLYYIKLIKNWFVNKRRKKKSTECKYLQKIKKWYNINKKIKQRFQHVFVR